MSSRSLQSFSHACRWHGITSTCFVLVVNIANQTVSLFAQLGSSACRRSGPVNTGVPNAYHFVRAFRCSTSRFGTGQMDGSNCTPLGLHRVAEKIGGGWPVGTVFKNRQPVGFTWQGLTDAKITTRILWLEGLEPGFNRGGKVDSHARHIYLHGTGDETTIGRPASCGCIHLAAEDLIPLYDSLPVGTLVWIER
jgi:L,D-transpeptidase YbiS